MQAEALVKILVRMTRSNMDVIYGDMATKVQQVRSQRSLRLRRPLGVSGERLP